MLDKFIQETIRQVISASSPTLPNRETAICLGDQRVEDGSSAKQFFSSLGYSCFFDIDYNGNATINFDLNYPLPLSIEKADLLYDGGVIEHVANIGQALVTIVQLVKVGGVLVQANPVNCFGDCYYNLDPMLHRDFYAANGFKQLKLQLYYKPGVRDLLVALADYWLPTHVNKNLRDKLRPTTANNVKRRFHDFLYRDTGVKLISMDRKHIWLKRRTHTLYVGVKERDVAKITWPKQSIYPAT